MKSKIIKVSIILIFMMFSAGLFNFCFALTNGTDYIITETVNLTGGTYKKGELYYKYDLPTIDNIFPTDKDYNGLEENLLECMNNNGYIVDYNIQNDKLYLKIPYYKDAYLQHNGSTTFGFYSPISTMVQNRTGGYWLTYDYSNKTWSFFTVDNYSCLCFNITGSSTDFCLFENNYFPMYSSTNTDFIYEPFTPPTEEELITNCDFKVNFKFSPDNDDYPTKVDKHWYVYETCLVTHTMSNWSSYKVDMSISANKENSRGGANTYFELYNNNGDKLINKHDLENNIAVNGDLAEGDFYLLLTDNTSDVMTITYNIYNNYTSELIMKKVYKVKFSQGGFGAVDYIGTIIEDSTYDKNGEIISGSNTGFETNGNDATTGTGSSDYYDVTDLELITNNATNTINLAKQCFSILPGFIWVMVGIFLSVCLALRILGR